ncbi:MAG: BatD family protein [Myxococcota bacterium]
MSAARALAALLFALAIEARAAVESAPLEVSLHVDRESVLLHEQVVLSIEIVHPADARASWEPPPFDGFWAERLGTRALPDEPNGLHRTEFRRALFPTRAGDLEIAPSKLVLIGDGGAERELPVPGARVHVRPLPAGVPPDLLVGHVEIHIVGGEDRVRLGKSLSLAVELAGEANVWDAQPPALDSLLGPDVEVFADPPRLSIGEGAGRATTRRTFHFALVPAHSGRVRMAPLEVSYFDPATGKVAVARSEPLAFDVFEGSASDEPRSPFSKRRPLAPDAEPWPLWPVGLTALLALAASATYLQRWRRAELARLPSGLSPRAAFDAASAARGTSDFHSLLARAVRAGVQARHHFDALPLTSGEIAARGAEREAVELLESLDRARFARRSADEESLLERTRTYLRL